MISPLPPRDPEDANFTDFAFDLPGFGRELTYMMDSREWRVREVIDPTTRRSVLLFTTTGIARRVRTCPPNCRELSSEELHRLSWSK
jgi:hypothetical protein